MTETEKPRFRKFRSSTPRADPQVVSRQMAVATLAFRTFGNSDDARTFLNEPNDALGARPIDVAGASAEGLQRVSDLVTRSGTGQAQP